MSLRARLVASVCLVAAVALTFAGVTTYTAFRSSQLRQIDDVLQRSHEPVEQLIDQGDADLDDSIGQVAPGLLVALISADGVTELRPARNPGHDSLRVDLSDLEVPNSAGDASADVPSFSTRASIGDGPHVRLRTSRLDDGTILVIGLSLGEVEKSRSRLIVIESVVAAIALLFAGGIGWLLVHIGLRPLRQVEATALRIADGGDLDQEVPGRGGTTTEIGRLASALNTMLGRIRAAFAERDAKELALQNSERRMRQFVADVSHELRTPLAAVAAYAELFDRGARDHPADLERALHGIGLESERMRELVEELLLLAHLDEGRPLSRERVDLNEIVVDAIAAARAVSPDWPISLRVAELVVVDGDASRLRQIVDNLLANVRTHTPVGTSTSITLRTAGDLGVMTVSDNGPGMTAEQAAHVFERFFRADPSRSRASGGAGLGMAIVHAVVEAHHGQIRLDTAPGAGVTITIELPLSRRDSGNDALGTND